jgi:hypothetical protein
LGNRLGPSSLMAAGDILKSCKVYSDKISDTKTDTVGEEQSNLVMGTCYME